MVLGFCAYVLSAFFVGHKGENTTIFGGIASSFVIRLEMILLMSMRTGALFISDVVAFARPGSELEYLEETEVLHEQDLLVWRPALACIA